MAAQGLSKPVAEVIVEGELSPFEHERIFRILKKRFSVSEPSYTELSDEDLVTRVTISFGYPYDSSFFTQIFQEGWHDLKSILNEVRHRRGRAGAAFNLVFVDGETSLVFKTGLLESELTSSALDQIGHLTSIVKKIMGFWTSKEPLIRVECVFDGSSDRWQIHRGYETSGRSSRFNEETSSWVNL